MGLAKYVAERNERLIIAARYGTRSVEESPSEYNELKKNERVQGVHGKKLHGHFLKQTENVASDERWTWFRKEHLKKETEGLLMASQSQSLRTNTINANIDKSQGDPLCRMCRKKEDTMNHLL